MTKLSIKKEILEEVFNNDPELVMFYDLWLKNDKSAPDAYIALKPSASRSTANIMGAKLLRQINIDVLYEAYGIGIDKYMRQMADGIDATKKEYNGEELEEVADHKTRRSYHEALGKQLDIEKKDASPNVQVNFMQQINNQKEKYDL